MAKLDAVTAALTAQEQNSEALLQLRNVRGIGTGYRIKGGKLTKEVCVQILVDKKVPLESLSTGNRVPGEVEGSGGMIGTDVLEITVEAQQPDTGRYRPVPAGVSIGPEASASAGTLGGWACDETDDTTVMLSNNHVISNLDTMPALRRILQPGRFDAGVLPGDVIGTLRRDVTVNTVPNDGFSVPNPSVVDAAIGTIDVGWTADLRQLNVPVIYELQAPALGMNVQKRGRTTRLTTNGSITTINTTIDITYRNRTRLGRVQNSFIITSTNGNIFSDSGDSGALILNQTEGELGGTFPVVGLLFGGGTNMFGIPITVANDINAVFGALNLTTLCACAVRAVIRAVFASESLEGRLAGPWWWERFLLRHKETQLRRFREQLRDSGRFSEKLEELIHHETALVGKILVEDDEAFGLLVNAVRPFLVQPTNYDILKTRLDKQTLQGLLRFSSRVSRRSRPMARKLAFAKVLASQIEGKTLGEVLRSANLTLGSGGRSGKKS